MPCLDRGCVWQQWGGWVHRLSLWPPTSVPQRVTVSTWSGLHTFQLSCLPVGSFKKQNIIISTNPEVAKQPEMLKNKRSNCGLTSTLAMTGIIHKAWVYYKAQWFRLISLGELTPVCYTVGSWTGSLNSLFNLVLHLHFTSFFWLLLFPPPVFHSVGWCWTQFCHSTKLIHQIGVISPILPKRNLRKVKHAHTRKSLVHQGRVFFFF